MIGAITGLLGLVPNWLWAAGTAGLVLHGCWVGHQRDSARNDLLELKASVTEADAARSRSALEANANFRKFERQQAVQASELENANQTHKLAAGTVDRSNRDDVDGVRRDVARLDAAARDAGLPSAAACPGELAASRRAAQNARGLLAACTAEYQDVANSAQREAIDLGTALGYADLVGTSAPGAP